MCRQSATFRGSLWTRGPLVLVLVALLLAGLGPVATVGPAEGAVSIQRLAGAHRVETAAMVATAWDRADDVVVATAANFPDALAGGALAASLDAPLLLSDGLELSEEVATSVDRLGARRAWLLGGEAALAPAVAQGLEARGVVVRRLAGGDRFGTAVAVSEQVGGGDGTALLTLGAADDPAKAFPDALSAGAFAVLDPPPPLLLARPSALPAASAAGLEAATTTGPVYALGGPLAMDDAVLESVRALGLETTRLAGGDRYATSVAVATHVLRRLDGPVPLVLASGANFPDGLAGAALAAHVDGLLLLVPPDGFSSDSSTSAFIAANAERIDSVTVLGGPVALSDATMSSVAGALDVGAVGGSGRPLQAFIGDAETIPTQAALVEHLSESGPPCHSAPVARVPMSAEEARASLRAWVEDVEDPAAIRAFEGTPAADDAAEAERFALQAAGHQRPGAVVLGLERAAALEPDDPTHLVNLAAVAVQGYRVHEALALLDAADATGLVPASSLDLDGGAMADTVRGSALVRLGRYEQATTVLRGAFAADSELREASQWLAHALACDGETDEAARVLRAGQRRPSAAKPAYTEVEGGETTSPPVSELVELSMGAGGEPAAFHMATSPREVAALKDYYSDWNNEISCGDACFAQRDRYAAWQRDLPPLVRTRVVRLRSAIGQDPLYKSTAADYLKALRSVPNFKPGGEGGNEGWLGCDKMGEVFEGIRPALVEIKETGEAWARAQSALGAALAAEIPHPQVAEDLAFEDRQALRYTGHKPIAAELAWWGRYWEGCFEQPTTDEPDDAAATVPEYVWCTDEQQERKFTFDIHVLSVSINCALIEVEVGTPGPLGLFLTSSQSFDYQGIADRLTVVAGARAVAEVPGTKSGVSYKEGFFLTTDKFGGIVDGGIRGEFGASLGGTARIEGTAGGVDISFVNGVKLY